MSTDTETKATNTTTTTTTAAGAAAAGATSAQTFKTRDIASWRAAYRAAASQPQPLLVHLNGDTTWLLQVPVPATEHSQPPPQTTTAKKEEEKKKDKRRARTHFNILIDPWLQGPQSDVASWFSTQWHVVAPSVRTIAELQTTLRQLEEDDEKEENDDDNDDDGNGAATRPTAQEGTQEGTESSYIDAVAISHEFTDHCHEATLRELPRSTPVFATDKAAELIRGWKYFDMVVTTPGYSFSSASSPPATTTTTTTQQQEKQGQEREKQAEDWHEVLSVAPLPAWLGIGRVVTPGNALYYHSAIVIVFDRTTAAPSTPSPLQKREAEAVLYSPHGIQPSDLSALTSSPSRHQIRTLALLHGLHDVRIWMAKQLNLGAHNGLASARACGARYWVATHDEVKSGGGVLAPFLRRLQWSVADAVAGIGGGGGAGGGGKTKKNEGKKEGKDEEGGKGSTAVVEGDVEKDGYEFVELGSGDGLVLVR